jgi:hypothetical protein
MREFSKERILEASQRDLGKQLSDSVAHFQRQADSNFNGKTWVEVGWAGLGECLQENIGALIKLAERWGSPPQWVSGQQEAYEQSALGLLLKRSEVNERQSSTPFSTPAED